jgi:hypothetical protein
VTASRRFANRYQFLFSYTLSKAEDNGTDFQSEFIAQDSGRGRNPNDLKGLPLGFDPNSEKGASVQDGRHRFVASATSVRRDSLTLPAQANVDLRVSHRFAAGGRTTLEGIFEVFNLFNRANYTAVNNVFGAGSYPSQPLSTFGQLTQSGPPRQVQLALKVGFNRPGCAECRSA